MDRNQEINIEKDFWDDFIVEAFENVDAIEQNAMSLEQNPEDMEIIHAMFRAFHTVKGLAGFVEHVIIQEIAHKTETMMDYCRKGVLKVDTDIINMILKSSDCIKTLCNDINAYKNPELMDTIEELLNHLEDTANRAEAILANGGCVQSSEQQASGENNQYNNQNFEQNTEQNVEQNFEINSQDFSQQEQQDVQNNDNQQNDFSQNEQNNDNPDAGLQCFAEEITEIQHEVEEKERLHEEIIHQQQENSQNNEQIIVEVPQTEIQNIEVTQEEPVQPETQAVQVTVAPVSPAVQQQLEEAKQEVTLVNVNEEQDDEYNRANPSNEGVQHKVLNEFQKEVLRKLMAQYSVSDESEGTTNHSGGNDEYMKVANYKIDHLVDIIGELIINQALIEQNILANYSEDRQLISNMSGFLRVTRDLQNLSMSLRMVSLKPTFQKLARIARDTIQQLKKDVEFVMSGESTEIDRAVAERLLEPLVHMIKNAISHGVEPNSDDRVAIGKPRKAKVELNAYSKRGKIYIEVKDDGRGINTDVVYKKALEKGIIDPNRVYSEAEIREFIMLPGFSTAEVVDNISGRGVGMDVVNTQIQKAGGRVEIISALNKGSTFVLEVPVNHSIMNGTIIEMNNQQFVVPTVNVKEFLQPKEEQWIFTKQERTMIRVRDNIIPMVPLSAFFGSECEEPKEIPLVMVLELEQELRAIPIVDVISRQEVVVKPVGEEFQKLKYISGMSILGSGNVSLILDIDYLFKKEVQ